MKEQDFAHIKYFDKKEIELTGSRIEEVQYETIRKLDDTREMLGCGIYILKNGLTTGEHGSQEHPDGKAVDFITAEERKAEVMHNVLMTCGFRGFGIYWNTIKNSYHADLGRYRTWKGMKMEGGVWVYSDLILNPQDCE